MSKTMTLVGVARNSGGGRGVEQEFLKADMRKEEGRTPGLYPHPHSSLEEDS